MIKIRLATHTDLIHLVQLEQLCFTSDRLLPQHLMRFLKSNASVLLCEIQHTIVGSAIILYRKNSHIARLYSFAVHPDYRNRGIAAHLLEECERFALDHTCTHLQLEVRIDNLIATRFYLKKGYTLFGRYDAFYEDKMDAARLHKTLSRKR